MDEEEWGRKDEDYETCEARENEKKNPKNASKKCGRRRIQSSAFPYIKQHFKTLLLLHPSY